MIRMWAKLVKNHKIIKDVIFERTGDIDYSEMFDYLVEICDKLDIPTPIIVKSNIFNYAKFNHVKFKAEDFVESVNFDYLLIENAAIA